MRREHSNPPELAAPVSLFEDFRGTSLLPPDFLLTIRLACCKILPKSKLGTRTRGKLGRTDSRTKSGKDRFRLKIWIRGDGSPGRLSNPA
jgi:hypothetical protein